MKQCLVCSEEKPIEEFGINNKAKDGRMNRCKECNKNISKRYYEAKNGTEEERQKLQDYLYNFILNLRNDGHRLKEIATQTGLDESSISYYLNGKRKVGINAVRKYLLQRST